MKHERTISRYTVLLLLKKKMILLAALLYDLAVTPAKSHNEAGATHA
jgi:hypothetical protein